MKANIHLTIDGTIETEDGLHLANKDYGKLLRERRWGRGFTLVQLSRMSGVSASEIGRIEQGKRSPSFVIVAKLERALCTPQEVKR